MKLSSLNCARPSALDEKDVLPPRPRKQIIGLLRRNRGVVSCTGAGIDGLENDNRCNTSLRRAPSPSPPMKTSSLHVTPPLPPPIPLPSSPCSPNMDLIDGPPGAPYYPGYNHCANVNVNLNPTVLSQTRDLLKGFILRKGASLTNPEQVFLNSLADEGGEEEMNNAMKVLSDQELFFNPCNSPKRSLTSLLCRNNSDYESRCIDDEYTSSLRDYNEDDDDHDDDVHVVKAHEIQMPKLDQDFNVEIVNSGDGAIILQDVDLNHGNGTGAYESPNFGISRKSLKPRHHNDRYKTPPIDTRRKSLDASSSRHGSSQRMARVAERRGSGVHASMWKAHSQGLSLSLTPASSFQSLRGRTASRTSSRCSSSSVNPSPFIARNGSSSMHGSNHGNDEIPPSAPSAGSGTVDTPPMQWPTDEVSEHLSATTPDETPSVTMSAIPGLDLAVSIVNDKKSGPSGPKTTNMRSSSSSSRRSSSHTFDPMTHFPSLQRGSGIHLNSQQRRSPLPPPVKTLRHSSNLSLASLRDSSNSKPRTSDPSPPPQLTLDDLRRRFSPKKKQNNNAADANANASNGNKNEESPSNGGSSEPSPTSASPHSRTTTTNSPGSPKAPKSPRTPRYNAPMRALRNPSPLGLRQLQNPRPDLPFLRQPNPSPTPSAITSSLHPKPNMYPQPNPPPPPQSTAPVPPTDDSDLRQLSNDSGSITAQINVLKDVFSQEETSGGKIESSEVLRMMDRESELDATCSSSTKTDDLDISSETIDKATAIRGSSSASESGDSMLVEIAAGLAEGEEEYSADSAAADGEKIDDAVAAATADATQNENVEMTETNTNTTPALSNENELHDNLQVLAASSSETEIEISHIKKAMSYDLSSSTQLRQDGENENVNRTFNLESLMDEDGMEDDDSNDIADVTQRYSYDAWKVLVDEYEKYGYGRGGFPFLILGTSADDTASMPHVLSPPLMESLYHFLPYSVSEENYYMKYSLLRDGASYYRMLQQVRASKHTILALETTEGEVFGSFSSSTWRKAKSYFGSGEAFLWKMKKDRKTICNSVLDQASLESEIEVYAWSGQNYLTQYCTNGKIALGGGGNGNEFPGMEGGFGLLIEEDLLNGETGYCATFGNPPLSPHGQFEIVNLEIWTLTPAITEAEAEKLELGRLFLESNRLH